MGRNSLFMRKSALFNKQAHLYACIKNSNKALGVSSLTQHDYRTVDKASIAPLACQVKC